MEEQEKFNISEHFLVPKHVKLTEEEKETILKTFNISLNQLPQILANDPAIQDLHLQQGDVIKILRKSSTVGETIFYRMVI